MRIALSPSVLARLIDSRSLTVADIRCLDAQSKQQVWRTCLHASLRGDGG